MSKRQLPLNYVETLESRIAQLEMLLRESQNTAAAATDTGAASPNEVDSISLSAAHCYAPGDESTCVYSNAETKSVQISHKTSQRYERRTRQQTESDSGKLGVSR